ncbi:hypothetical protein T440DRAFT_493260 [Plenodomus tracheiphilus IPT5]|uniref:Zn(2)-C6 fungal-type domain-containing protein n=1 Tax=Plenodomus tracheiphilus IPT5 TaxID=1408161 RepID=A0A6A7ASI7_9PLEO|nr:hypothetical protein T440DRAFT_493260 [Plenodomus tracheiphilus IPT5]
MIPVTQKASNVCAYCRVRKQRCDRTLPRCQRCAAKDRHCDYTPYKEPMRQDYREPEPLILHSDICFHTEVSQRGATELLHTVIACKEGPLISTANPKLSALVYEILDHADVDMAVVLEEFGPCISQWCPIIPENLLARCASDLAMQTPRPERVNYPLLLLCLWLVTRRTCSNPDHVEKCELYRTLKLLLALLQSRADIELGGVQVGMLISVYEVGHGMQKQAVQTIASCAALLKILDLEARKQNAEEAIALIEWLQVSMLMLDRLIPLSMLSDSVPLVLRSTDPTSKAVANRLMPGVPPPSHQQTPTSPRKIHIRAAVALAAGPALEYIYARQHGLEPEQTYDQVDDVIAECIKVLVDKPQPHTWLHCDAIAMAFSSHILLQQAQMTHLSANMVHFTVPGPDYTKAHLALKYSRRMAWDMVRTAIQKIQFEAEIPHLPFAGLCCVLRAGVAVIETAEFMAEEVTEPEEIGEFLKILDWFSVRWSIGREYIRRVEEMLHHG